MLLRLYLEALLGVWWVRRAQGWEEERRLVDGLTCAAGEITSNFIKTNQGLSGPFSRQANIAFMSLMPRVLHGSRGSPVDEALSSGSSSSSSFRLVDPDSPAPSFFLRSVDSLRWLPDSLLSFGDTLQKNIIDTLYEIYLWHFFGVRQRGISIINSLVEKTGIILSSSKT